MCCLYELPGYYMYSNSRNVHGGGVAMYVINNYDSSVQSQLEISNSSIESFGVVTVIVEKKYLFLCKYRPPSGNFNNFLNVMTTSLKSDTLGYDDRSKAHFISFIHPFNPYN